MRRVSGERWQQIFKACGVMEGDLIGLEVELFPDGGSFPAASSLSACNAPLQQPLAERTCDNIIPSGELAVKARGGRN
eukprot:5708267-Pleurochrysis_carterae.AAC.1